MPDAGIFGGNRIKDASIDDIKLNQLVTAGKVANSATTATASGTVNTIVARDSNGDFDARLITLSGTPTLDTHVVTRGFVNTLLNGFDFKGSVRLATTANITLSGLQTIDGVTTVASDRVLVKNQTTASQNGIYLAASGSWTRTADADSSADVTPGLYVVVEEGSTNTNTRWLLTTNAPIVLNTTNLTFTQMADAAAIVAGNGLSRTGNQLDVLVDDSSIEINADTLRVKALGITNAMLAGSIADTKLSTITSAGKVANSATTGVATATANTLVLRDANGRAAFATPAASGDAATKGYVDGKIAGTLVVNETPAGTVNGVNVTFTLANAPLAGTARLYVDGIRLLPTTHFTISSTTLTYVANFQPVSAESHRIDYQY